MTLCKVETKLVSLREFCSCGVYIIMKKTCVSESNEAKNCNLYGISKFKFQREYYKREGG